MTNRISPDTCYVHSVLQAHDCDDIHTALLCRSSCDKESAFIIMAGFKGQKSNCHVHGFPFERFLVFVRANENLTQGLVMHNFTKDPCSVDLS